MDSILKNQLSLHDMVANLSLKVMSFTLNPILQNHIS